MAFGVVLGLLLHELREVAQVVRLDGAQALHEQLGDLDLLVVLGLGHPQLGLALEAHVRKLDPAPFPGFVLDRFILQGAICNIFI